MAAGSTHQQQARAARAQRTEGFRMSTWWRRVALSRPPDFVIGNDYVRRWWLVPRNRFGNAYLHQFLHSDDDRALHDHMYVNLSIILEGVYVEHEILAGGVQRATRRTAGEWKLRRPSAAHMIELDPGTECWTLFLTGPRVREWGFHCPKGWRHWREFTDDRDAGKVGKGCE
jgi:hypothetical protein